MGDHYIAETRENEVPAEVERTQTDRINNQLLKSFLTRLNTDPQFQSVVTQGQGEPATTAEGQTRNPDFD